MVRPSRSSSSADLASFSLSTFAAGPTAAITPSRSRIAPWRTTLRSARAPPRRGERPATVTTCAAPRIRREVLTAGLLCLKLPIELSQPGLSRCCGFRTVGRREYFLGEGLDRGRRSVLLGTRFLRSEQPLVARILHFGHQAGGLFGNAQLFDALFNQERGKFLVGKLGLADGPADGGGYFMVRDVALPQHFARREPAEVERGQQ